MISALFFKKWTAWTAVSISLFVMISCQGPDEKVSPRPMEVLFLGHGSVHHNSRAYEPMLQAQLAPEGFNFTYTEDLDDLKTDNLSKYDALILFANHDEISQPQADGLLTFVKDGGGFVPIHCASFCFRNNSEVVKLIGGQFESHDTATFTAKIIALDHPALEGFEEFTSWDETYKHAKLTKDIEVLMERVDGEEKEPYTWVKQYGRGRVFYTALGHDERTWSKPEFIALIEGGLRWAIGDVKSKALDSLDLPELEYTSAKIPNYEKRDPPPMLQKPLSAESSQKRIQVPPGFTLKLFAKEPDILNPISMAWDERGRLWILETRDYPNEIKSEDGVGSDRIKILEDTDGDGSADKFTVFADGLSVPTSMVFSNGGVIVSQAPHFLFLKDTDGDDVADERRILFSGWGTFDTHAGPSNLQYGMDNQIWGVVGYSSFEGRVGEQDHSFRQGAYRFIPDGSSLEFMGSTSNNTWGLGFTEDFDVLISTANNTHSAFLGIPERYFEDVEGLKIKSVKKIDGHYGFHPNTENFRQVDVFGGFTAAAGHHLYTARTYPEYYWNRVALVCEPTGHLLHQAIVEPSGAGYVERDGWNLLASSDEWVSPVHAQVGPDGAVWIADWYNFIIQHNPTPTGFENGKGNAHINPLRDKQHGRIYRLAYGEEADVEYPDLQSLDMAVATLENDNLLWRMHAQRLIVEAKYVDCQSRLLEMLENQRTDKLGLAPGALHALWTLEGLGLVSEDHLEVAQAVGQALQHNSASVRKNAIRVLGASGLKNALVSGKDMVHDEDPGVRLAAILYLIEHGKTEEVGETLYALSNEESVLSDEWLARAVYVGTVHHRESFSKAMYRHAPHKISDGYKENKELVDWSGDEVDTEAWSVLSVPGRWSDTKVSELQDFDGVVWVRKEFELPSDMARRSGVLKLGPIDDSDVTYLNGKQIGSSTNKSNEERTYRIPSNLLRSGKNQLSIRITDDRGRGGIHDKEAQLLLTAGTGEIELSGDWKFKIEEQFFPERAIFEDGLGIVDLFLKYHGPYASALSKTLPAVSAYDQIVTIKTIPDQMKYDVPEFTVQAGQRVRIQLENNDGMQHNMLIGSPGSLEVIGKAADAMAQVADAADKGYIPVVPDVLASVGLVDPGSTAEMIWDVPDEVGEYVYVCTFPGHWRTMNGIIHVI